MELGDRLMVVGEVVVDSSQPTTANTPPPSHWNPGIIATSSPTALWQPIGQQPNNCLINLPPSSTADTASIFDYPLVLPTRLSLDFRHRFQQAVHFGGIAAASAVATASDPSSSSSSHHHHHHHHHSEELGLQQQRSLVDDEGDNGSVPRSDGQSLGISNDLGDDTDDCSDDEDEEDEENDDEEEDDGSGLRIDDTYNVHTIPNPMVHSMDMEDESLSSCQQQQQQQHSNSLDLMSDIPAINDGHHHPLNSNPISTIPMINGNCGSMMIADETEVLVSNNPAPQSGNPMNLNNGEPAPGATATMGHSVHGKMYVEERVVFHLKQWTDSGFGHFNSCREQEPNFHFRCAVCHLDAQHLNGQQKDTHRHAVRGVLCAFDDCIILELYPEENFIEETNHTVAEPEHDLLMDKHTNSPKTQQQQPLPLSFFDPAPSQHHPPMDNLVVLPSSSTSMDKPPSPINNQEWWEYDTSQGENHHQTHHNPNSCEINLKLSAQRYHDAEAAAEVAVIQELAETELTNEQSVDYERNNQQTNFDESGGGAPYYCNPPSPCGDDDDSLTQNNGLKDVQDGYAGNSEAFSAVSVLHVEPPTTSTVVTSKPTVVKKELEKYPCPCCKKSFRLKRYLKDHLEEKHDAGNPYQCKLCKMQYSDVKRLQRHSCTLSVESIKNRLKLKQQQQNHQESLEEEAEQTTNKTREEILIETFIIPSKSSKVRKFAEKMKRINDENETCSSSSKNHKESLAKSKLKCPVIRISQDDNVDVNKPTDPSSSTQQQQPEFKCNICGKTFKMERRLLNHTASHKPLWQCNHCPKKFQRRDKLYRHLYSHSSEKLFPCDICSKRFSRQDKLADHLRSHQSEEIHNCHMCERRFLRPDILKQHVKMHQLGNKHQCPECLRFVTGKNRLEQHMKRHEEAKAQDQTLYCPLCTKYYIQYQSLKAHFRKFHPESMDQLVPPPPPTEKKAEKEKVKRKVVKQIPTPTTVNTVLTGGAPVSTLSNIAYKSKIKVKEKKVGGGPYSCLVCPKTFVRKDNLLSHEAKQHPNLYKRSATQPKPGKNQQPKILKKKRVVKKKEDISSPVPDDIPVSTTYHPPPPPTNNGYFTSSTSIQTPPPPPSASAILPTDDEINDEPSPSSSSSSSNNVFVNATHHFVNYLSSFRN